MKYFFLAITATLSLSALAQSSPASRVLSSFDQVLAQIDAKPKAQADELAANRDLFAGVVSDELELSAPDHNEFLLEALARYTAHPEQRRSLYTLLSAIHAELEPEFKTQHFRFWGPTVDGMTDYAAVLLLLKGSTGFLARKLFVNAAAREAARASEGSTEVILEIKRFDVSKRNYLIAAGAGITLSHLWQLLLISRTQKLDPLPMLTTLNASLVCDLAGAVQSTSDVAKLNDFKLQAEVLGHIDPSLGNEFRSNPDLVKAFAARAPAPAFDHVLPRNLRCEEVSTEFVGSVAQERIDHGGRAVDEDAAE